MEIRLLVFLFSIDMGSEVVYAGVFSFKVSRGVGEGETKGLMVRIGMVQVV